MSCIKEQMATLGSFVTLAYAEELNPEVQQAAYRRKDRRDQLSSYEAKGVIGENRSGFVVIRNPGAADISAQEIVNAENSDRMMIYQSVAKKNGSSVEAVEDLYAKRLQADAPSGAPIETADGWVVK